MGATEALVAWARGGWDDAFVAARQTIADRGSERAVAIAQWAVGFAAFGRGDLDAADEALRAALALGAASGAIDLVLPPRWGLAEAALLANRPDEAAAHCQEALSLAQGVGERWLLVPFVVTGVRAEHAAGRPAEAEAWLEACARHLAPIAAAAGPALDHGRGLVALAAGSTGIARQALEAAVDGWDERMRTWEATWARLDLGHCLTRLNRFAEAVALAVDARTVASRLDSRPLAERADALHRLARGHVSVDEPWRPLTAREFAVARLISEGHTNAEIATELSIAPKTASSHVEHILAKLGASRRTVLFPLIKRLEAAATLPPIHCGSVDNPILVMEHEHDSAGSALKRLRDLSGGFVAPADGCPTYQVLFHELAEFEADLHRHIHRENNILFPKASEIEALLRERAQGSPSRALGRSDQPARCGQSLASTRGNARDSPASPARAGSCIGPRDEGQMMAEDFGDSLERRDPMKRLLGSVFVLAIVALPLARAPGRGRPENDKPADEATTLAVKLTEEGAATFDTFNAKAMADYYLDDAEIALVTRDGEGLKVQTLQGTRPRSRRPMPTSSRSPRRSSRGTPSSTPSSSPPTSW